MDRGILSTLRVGWLLVGLLLLGSATARAQAIPPPTNPLVFCGIQALPAPTSYTLIIDGGAPAPLVMDATKSPVCPAASTHSFVVPAAVFTLGLRTFVVTAINAVGPTVGPPYPITVGLAPGAFTITNVVLPGGAVLRKQPDLERHE